MKVKKGILFLMVVMMMAAGLSGCKTQKSAYINPDDEDSLGGTGIDSGDVRTVCEKLCQSIVATPEIQNATERPRIALTKVDNNTRFRIDTDIFTEMMRDELINYAGGKMRFLAREDLDNIMQERQDKREGLFDGETDKKLKGADYFLTGTLRSISKASGEGRSDYIVYMFRLLDAESSEIVWSGRYETKKQGVWSTVYR